jgi:threonyl-tRNA synthetase
VTLDVGGAKFYGPAIDLQAVDAMGREWQGTTIQLDMNEPLRFGMKYIGSDGQEHTPIMLHRTLLGAMERFVGVLIEHCGAAFPTWLAPVQVVIMSITSRSDERVNELTQYFRDMDVRADADLRNEKIGYKIREAQVTKVPYMLIVGDKEIEDGMVAVRSGSGGDLGKMSLEEFESMLMQEIKSKALRK